MKIISNILALWQSRSFVTITFWCLWAITAICLLLWLFWDMGYRFNATVSMPKGVYQISSETPNRGEFGIFCLRGTAAALALERAYVTEGSCPSGLQPLLKRVAGLPGDTILQTAEGIFINERLEPHSATKEVDSHGRSMQPPLLPGVIPPEMSLMLADHDASFDSRYFGLVPLKDLERVKLIFTF